MTRTTTLVPVKEAGDMVIRPAESESLAAWVQLYGVVEVGSNAENTIRAKGQDLRLFLTYFRDHVASDHPDQWTKSVTGGFLRHLENVLGRKPTTVNRVLSTLRHCSAWINRHRRFLADDPCSRIKELTTDDPEWKGLTDTEVMRLKSAGEQLLKLKLRRNQSPVRDFAIFLTLLHTGLRCSELIRLDGHQYQGKHFLDVKRKGKIRTRLVFVPKEAREAIDAYFSTSGKSDAGPLFRSRKGSRLSRQQVDRLLKEFAAQANARLPANQQVRVSAHVLRHTFLRKVAQQHGVQFAMEAAGHASSKYIFRYVKPSEAEKEQALDGLF